MRKQLTKKRLKELQRESNVMGYRMLMTGKYSPEDEARLKEIRAEKGMLLEPVFIDTGHGSLMLDYEEDVAEARLKYGSKEK